jgi:hypothetical protein
LVLLRTFGFCWSFFGFLDALGLSLDFLDALGLSLDFLDALGLSLDFWMLGFFLGLGDLVSIN